MKYLLLEKDFEHRDALDLISRHRIGEYLESQFAENVVQEIWRSSYATQDSILSASTNHMLVWHYWHTIRDLEADQPFMKLKDVNKIEAHPMQFTVWRNSPKARVMIEFLVTVAFATAVHILVARVMDITPSLTQNMNQFIYMTNQLNLITNSTSPAYISQYNLT